MFQKQPEDKTTLIFFHENAGSKQ